MNSSFRFVFNCINLLTYVAPSGCMTFHILLEGVGGGFEGGGIVDVFIPPKTLLKIPKI